MDGGNPKPSLSKKYGFRYLSTGSVCILGQDTKLDCTFLSPDLSLGKIQVFMRLGLQTQMLTGAGLMIETFLF